MLGFFGVYRRYYYADKITCRVVTLALIWTDNEVRVSVGDW